MDLDLAVKGVTAMAPVHARVLLLVFDRLDIFNLIKLWVIGVLLVVGGATRRCGLLRKWGR